MSSSVDNDEVFEGGYYYDDSPPLSREQSIQEEYILSESSNEEEQDTNTISQETQESRPKKTDIRDIYDENNYTLAKTSGIDPHNNVIIGSEVSSNKMAFKSFSKKKIVAGIVIGMLTLCAIGGVCMFVLMDKQGTCNTLLIKKYHSINLIFYIRL